MLDVICHGSWRLNPERIMGIVSLPWPKTKREVRKFLGLLGYSRLWIEGYAVKLLYEKLVEEKIRWEKEDEQKFEDLKQKLSQCTGIESSCFRQTFLSICGCRKRGST